MLAFSWTTTFGAGWRDGTFALTYLKKKFHRLSLVPPPLWGALAGHKLKSEFWTAYERFLEVPFQLNNPSRSEEKFNTAFLHLFHDDVFLPTFGARMKSKFPDHVAERVKTADALVNLKWDVLGSGPVDLRMFHKQSLVPWHTDIRSGFEWPASQFHADVRIGPRESADIKVPWEMSRGQNLLALAQAYRLTKDEVYAQGFVAQIGDWIQHNPYGRGPNWANAMEVALRACNWIAALELFQDSPTLIDPVKNKIVTSLSHHRLFLSRHLEWNATVSTNHYLCDVIGLIYLGLFFKDSDAVDAALADFEKESLVQIDARGWDYEASTAYHRFAIEIVFAAVWAARQAKKSPPAVLFEKLGLMAERLKEVSDSQGRMPLIGDNDSGRILPLSGRLDSEVAPWPEVISSLLGHPNTGVSPESAWLFGLSPQRGPVTTVPPSVPKMATLVVLKGDADTLVLSAWPTGTNGIGNHTHNDRLSFTLSVGGDDFLVDPGTASYTGQPALRNQMRSTACHSTVEVDHREQNDFLAGDLFTLKNDAKVEIDEWVPNKFVQAHHTGYRKLPDPVVHHRRIERLEGPLRWIVTDQLTGQTEHTLRWSFVTGPNVLIMPRSPTEFDMKGVRGVLTLKVGSPRFTLSIEDAPCSPGYGVLKSTKVIKINLIQTLPVHMKFELSWRPLGHGA